MKKTFLALIVSAVGLSATAGEFSAGPSGGQGGVAFYDDPPSTFLQLDYIKLCGHKLVDSIEVAYKDTNNYPQHYGRHGGNGGYCKVLSFWSGEYITSVSGNHGRYVDSLKITTNQGKSIEVGTYSVAGKFEYTGNDQFTIAGFKGRSQTLIDAIGVVYFQKY